MTRPKDTIIIGIDSSTTNIGVALYTNGDLRETRNFSYKGTYDLLKLNKIVDDMEQLVSHFEPIMIVIEEPINVRNARAAMALNQVYGAILTVCHMYGVDVFPLHNKVIKRYMEISTKEDSLRRFKEVYPKIYNRDKTDHESDAVMAVEAYKKLVNERG